MQDSRQDLRQINQENGLRGEVIAGHIIHKSQVKQGIPQTRYPIIDSNLAINPISKENVVLRLAFQKLNYKQMLSLIVRLTSSTS